MLWKQGLLELNGLQQTSAPHLHLHLATTPSRARFQRFAACVSTTILRVHRSSRCAYEAWRPYLHASGM